jgi:hypothetical protein
MIALSVLWVLACGPSPSPVAKPTSATAAEAPPSATDEDAAPPSPNDEVTLEDEMTFDDEEEEPATATEPETIVDDSTPSKMYVRGERVTDAPSGSFVRREHNTSQTVRPSADVIRDLETKGYSGIVTYLNVCVGVNGKEIFRKAGKTPYPDWDRLVLELSYQRDISWLKGWADEGTACSGWLVAWATDQQDAIDYSTYVLGRPVTDIPDKLEGKDVQDDTHRDVAELSVKPPRGVLRRMKKAGKTTIATTVVVCADTNGKTFFREVGKTAYSAYDRLVLKASRKLNLDAVDRPLCAQWAASWSIKNAGGR